MSSASNRKRIIQSILVIVLVVSGLYGVIVGFMALNESAFIFHPTPVSSEWNTPEQVGLPYTDVMFPLDTGEKIHGWWVENNNTGPTILFFHGNAGNVSFWLERLSMIMKLTPQPHGILVIDYPGFGKSSGKPSERGCFAAGIKAVGYLRDTYGVKQERLIIWGHSLGASVALATATTTPCAGLIMEAPFRSITEMARIVFPFLPGLRWANRQKFDNEAMITQLKVPLLLMHGDQDEVIPVDQGRYLASIAPQPKTYLEIPGGRHNDLYSSGKTQYQQAVEQFLAEQIR